MKGLLQFLVKNSIFLLFIGLEVLSIVLVVQNNEYPKSATFASTNRVVASVYSLTHTVTDYFHLRTENEDLAEENVALRNQITQLEACLAEQPDSLGLFHITSPFSFISAQVINQTAHQQKNFLTINKGEQDGVLPDRGVISKDGVVGVVATVSDHYALVIPILNPAFAVSCKIKRNGYIGSLQWDGLDYRYAQLTDIARHIEVKEGDTIVTSGVSDLFVADIPVGVIEKDELNESDAYHQIKVALAVDFRRLTNVCVVQNQDREEIEQLEEQSAHL